MRHLNLPLNKEQYLDFYNELIKAKRAELKDFEKVFYNLLKINEIML